VHELFVACSIISDKDVLPDGSEIILSTCTKVSATSVFCCFDGGFLSLGALSQTDKYVASENVQYAIQNKLLVNEIKLVKSELKMFKTPQSKKNIFKTEETGQGSGKKNTKMCFLMVQK
jgi:hypothetical protein